MNYIRNALIVFVGMSLITLAVTVFVPSLTPGQKSQAAPAAPTLNVNVVNTESEPVPVSGTVNVGNLGANPVPVRDLNNPARQPVFINGSYTVPAGKLLTIEYVSLGIEALSQCQALIAAVSSSGIPLHVYHPTFVGVALPSPGVTSYRYVFSQEARAYVAQNRTVTFEIISAFGCNPDLQLIGASGYLVDLQ
jgi:hypothetical protein